MRSTSPRRQRVRGLLLSLGLGLALASCSTAAPDPRSRLAATAPPERVAPALHQALLPRSAAPSGLTPGRATPLDNAAAAAFFAHPATVLERLADAGRREGAYLAFAPRPRPTPSGASAVAVSVAASRVVSSIALYRDAAAADAVFADPLAAAALAQRGLVGSTELAVRDAPAPSPTAALPLRRFRSPSPSGPGNSVTYLAQFRRAHTIGAVTVTLAPDADDGGALALALARRQAAQPLPALTQQ